MSIQSVKKKEMKVSRIAHEKKTVELMIRLYCRKKEKNKILCTDCKEINPVFHDIIGWYFLALPSRFRPGD